MLCIDENCTSCISSLKYINKLTNACLFTEKSLKLAEYFDLDNLIDYS